MEKSLEEMKELLKVLTESLKNKSEEEDKYTVAICKDKSLEEMKQLLKVLVETSKKKSEDQEEMKQLLKVVAETCKAKFEEDNKYTVAICKGIIDENEMKKCFKCIEYDRFGIRYEGYHYDDETYFDVMKSFENKGCREVFVNMSYAQRKRWIDRIRQSKKE